MFYIFSRYRLPVVPFFIIFSSYTILWYIKKIKDRQWNKILLATAAFILLYFLVHTEQFLPKNMLAVSHFNLGESYRKAGDYKKAIEEFETAIRANPDYDKLYNNLACMYYEEKNIDKAIELWLEAIAINPEHFDARLNLAKAYIRKNNLTQAKIMLEESLRLNNDQPEARKLIDIISGLSMKSGMEQKITFEYDSSGKRIPHVDYIGGK